MASGLSISGTVFTVGASNISVQVPVNITPGQMYRNATQYRYPRVTTNIGIGSYYRNKTFYNLGATGANSTRLTGTCAIGVNWGVISWNSGSIIIPTATGSVVTRTPVAADGYPVYMDTATSTTATVSVTTSLYNGTFSGWIPSQGGAVISTANPYSWANLASTNTVYAYWT